MSSADRAQQLVIGWARLYARGLPEGLAQRRLDELASDCHEQRQWGREVGASPVMVATSMVARTLAGMPADLLWRHQQIAVAQDRPLATRGHDMGRWMARNWWLALAGIAGAMEVALGVLLPFEDRTTGSIYGGIVIGVLGATALAGLVVRRRHRVRGDLMVAAGMLPFLPFLWTVWMPLVGLTVIVMACIDTADDASVGLSTTPRDADETSSPDGPLRAIIGALVAAVIAAVVIGQPGPAVQLVALPLAGLLAYLGLRRRMPGVPLARTGLMLLVTAIGNGLLTTLAVITFESDLQLGSGPVAVVVYIAGGFLAPAGVVLLLVGLLRARDQARPA